MRLDEVENGTVALNAGRRNLKGTTDLIMMNYKQIPGYSGVWCWNSGDVKSWGLWLLQLLGSSS